MLAKIIDYWRRSLDYPVDANEKSKFTEGLHYFLDLSHIFDSFPFNHLVFDPDGIVQYDYGRVKQPNQPLGIQYNTTYICWWAISRLEIFLRSGDAEAKKEFLRHAEWLLKNKKHIGEFAVWPFRFDYRPELRWLRAPWISAMDQGLVISVLIRAYKITEDKRYLDASKQAGLFFAVPLESGGFRVKFNNRDYYFEMYPVLPFSRILDGYLFSLMGLYDLSCLWRDTRILDLYNDGINTLLKNIDYWDFDGVWSRFGRYYLSPPWYHKLNYAWLKVVYSLTGDEKIHNVAVSWDPKKLSFIRKIEIKVLSYVYSRKAYLILRFRKLFYREERDSHIPVTAQT